MNFLRTIVGCLGAIALTLPVVAASLEGVVIGVSDGDTVTVLDSHKQQHKIRLSGIDAPEKTQPFGQASKASLSELIFGKFVSVDWDKQD